MARTTIKGTYALDAKTVRALEEMARRWNVSKSEALRRAIEASARAGAAAPDALAALDALQRSLALDAEAAAAWVRRVRSERRAAAARRKARR
ncbi:MAG: ribbon-helix-helix protein, CopG family [Gemmatimonadales bacterium]